MKYLCSFTSRLVIALSITSAAGLAQISPVLSSPASAGNKALPELRMVYLIPSDRVYHDEYASAIEEAIRQLDAWYQNQMGDTKTFELHKPVVEVIPTSHPSSWYSTNQAGADPTLWFWYNALADGFAALSGGFNDPNNRWVFYIDADPACGQLTGGTSGVALLPANDLRGLTGQTNIPVCAGDKVDTAGLCRWVGGLGHELGHAFGLPHPPLCPGGPDTGALMCLGYIIYPNSSLLAADKVTLEASPFFLPSHSPTYHSKNFGCPLILKK